MPTVEREGPEPLAIDRVAFKRALVCAICDGAFGKHHEAADAFMTGPALAPILAQADTAAQAQADRDEADRRAGAAERRYENERDTTMKRGWWLREAKERAGYHDDISFDTVWAETLAKAESLSAEVERLRAALDAAAEVVHADSGYSSYQTTIDSEEASNLRHCRDIVLAARTALAAGQDKEGGKPSVPSTDAPAAAQEGKTP